MRSRGHHVVVRSGVRARCAAVTVGAAVVLLGPVGCSDEGGDLATQVPTSVVPGPSGSPATPIDALVARLATVDTADLKLGREFNAQFLSLQFQAIGLTEAEAACATGIVAASPGPDFATRPVSQIVSGTGITPDVLTPCVPTERLMELASGGVTPDLSRAPAQMVRATFTELASAGYESVGLTPVEAACVAEAVVGGYGDGELAGPLTSLDVDTDRTAAAIPGCVTDERVVELGR